MAGKPAIQVTGAKELRRALKRMGADLADLKEINLEAARRVADRAAQRAPFRTGRLQRSIKARATKASGSVTAGGRLIPYAGPIHFGWPRHNINPQPFIYEALDDRRIEVVALYEKRVGDLVERVGRETP